MSDARAAAGPRTATDPALPRGAGAGASEPTRPTATRPTAIRPIEPIKPTEGVHR
ncbi:hypothetical protein SCWH03_24640 [Streptomyces pacificus]|uniref:Uncharacterized protein n=1 Tax=Streptomyces pacificus TaxID=2705029 RepID=A0A6A0AUA5_9ACTN|nr:hypothetical protein SCWH03_24640 [Streptomyces pacificus]